MKTLVLTSLTLVLLTSCSKYKGIGKFESSDTIFDADVTHYWYGGASIDFQKRNSNVQCHGKALLTKPKSVCKGQSGTFHASCNDGTILDGKWKALSCFEGEGRGKSQTGEVFIFNFGHSKRDESTLR